MTNRAMVDTLYFVNGFVTRFEFQALLFAAIAYWQCDGVFVKLEKDDPKWLTDERIILGVRFAPLNLGRLGNVSVFLDKMTECFPGNSFKLHFNGSYPHIFNYHIICKIVGKDRQGIVEMLKDSFEYKYTPLYDHADLIEVKATYVHTSLFASKVVNAKLREHDIL